MPRCQLFSRKTKSAFFLGVAALIAGCGSGTTPSSGSGGGSSTPPAPSSPTPPHATVTQTSTARVQSIALQAKDLLWDSTHGKLFASVPASGLVTIDPATLTASPALPIGNQPDHLSISSDGSYLWVGLDGDKAVQRLLLPSLAKDILIPVPTQQYSSQPVAVQASNITPHTVAILAGAIGGSPSGVNLYIFDDAVQRPTHLSVGSNGTGYVDWIQWGKDDSIIYGTQYTTIDAPGLSTINVNASGATGGALYGGDAITSAAPNQFDPASGLLYTSYGAAIDAANHTLVGDYFMGDTTDSICTEDGLLKRVYCIGNAYTGTDVNEYLLRIFDQPSFKIVGQVSLAPTVSGYPLKLIRWGVAGLALLTEPQNLVGSNDVYLIDGTAINPAVPPDTTAGTAVYPVEFESAVNPQQAPVGSSDTTVEVFGSNFTTTSQVTYNSNYIQVQTLATTFVSTTQLQAVIPASLMTSARTLNLSVYDAAQPSANLFGYNSQSFTVYTVPPAASSFTALNVAPLAAAWDATDKLLLVGTSDLDPNYPNSIVAINPTNGAVVASQQVYEDPYILSEGAADKYLYVAFAGATNETQLSLPNLNLVATWPLFTPLSNSVYGIGPYFAGDLQAAPVNPTTTAATLWIEPSQLNYTTTEIGGLAIYDGPVQRIQGVSPNIFSGYPVDSLAWGASDTVLYGLKEYSYNSGTLSLDQFAINATGASFSGADGSFSSPDGAMHFNKVTGFIYNDNGQVINAATGSPVGNLAAAGLVESDDALGVVFVLGQTASQSSTSNFTLASFNAKTLAPISSVVINGLLGTPIQLVSAGISGLALLTYNSSFGGYGGPGYGGPAGMTYIIQNSTFVAPALQSATSQAVPDDIQIRWPRLSHAVVRSLLQHNAAAKSSK